MIIANEIGIDESLVLIDERITEYDMGDLSGKPWGIISSKILINAKNSENILDFKNRILDCVLNIKENKKNTLIVSHAGVYRIIETIEKKLNPDLFYDLPAIKNSEIKIVNI